jgi:hypothetical protein
MDAMDVFLSEIYKTYAIPELDLRVMKLPGDNLWQVMYRCCFVALLICRLPICISITWRFRLLCVTVMANPLGINLIRLRVLRLLVVRWRG